MKIWEGLAFAGVLILTACAPSGSPNENSLQLANESMHSIVGGQDATPTDHLAVVRIVDGFERSCSGTLISENIVLTAAHCLKSGGELEVFFAADPEVSIMSTELVPHEHFLNASSGVMKLKVLHKNDIGLIWLSKSAPEKAVPALMPEKLVHQSPLSVRAVGYGRTGSANNDGNVLRAVELLANFRAESPEHFFFDQSIGKGVCKGDSGGPLFVPSKARPIVVGIVNGPDDMDAFFGEPVGDECLYTGVATQVAAHKEWIIQKSEALIKKYLPPKKRTFQDGLSTDQALCRKPFPTFEAMKAELNALSFAESKVNAAVGGLLIKDENPKLIEAYRYLVSYKTYQFKPDVDIDFWHLFKDLKCEKALCAAQTVFGPQDGILFLYVAVKYKIVLSSLGLDRLKPPKAEDQKEFDAYFKVRPWKKGELVPYLNALPMLPGIPLPTYVRMNHAGMVNPMNANVLSNGIIHFYTPMDAMTDSHKEHTAFHEVAHNYGTFYGLDSSKEWLAASGWERKEKTYTNVRPQEFVNKYAAKDFIEDFAESFTYYRYYPQILKTKSPTRYEYFKKNLYLGHEFLSLSECK